MKSLLPVGLLSIALLLLAGLQYRWIGQISQAERQRLEIGLRESSLRFQQEFASEMAYLLGAFQGREAFRLGDVADQAGERYRDFSRTASHPNLVESIYVAESFPQKPLRLRQLTLDGEESEITAWPSDLSELTVFFERESVGPPTERRGQGPPPRELNLNGATVFVVQIPPQFGPRAWVVLKLDKAVITNEILPALVQSHFPNVDEQNYRVAVGDANDPSEIIYSSSRTWNSDDVTHPDFVIPLPPGETPGGPRGRGPGPERGFGPERGPDRGRGRGPGFGPGPRQSEQPGPGRVIILGQRLRLLVKHESGSLETAVESARRRNLAVSFGVLVVLAGGALAAVVSGQRARALGKLQMEFAAGVSHELRTPIAVIQSAAHNLGAGIVRDPESIEQYASIVQTEARRLSSMVEQVMAYAETQSGRKRYDVSAVDVRDVVEQALKILTVIGDSDVTVDQRYSSELPPALGDPAALTQCLQNLISNAVKYGRKDGAVHIEIEAICDRSAGKIRLSVKDRGPGVPSADVRKLFEPFHRGANALANTPGNGLGLHLVRKMMEGQNGAVAYAPNPEGGACFTLTVPVAQASV